MPKKDNTKYYIIAFAVIILAAAIYFRGGDILNYYQGGGGSNYYYQGGVPEHPQTEYYQYNVNLVTDKTTICVGDDLRITVSSNIPNGVCAVFYNYNSQGWNILQSAVQLDANGYYSTQMQINIAAGTYLGKVVCGDLQGNWRTSNTIQLIVQDCGNNDGNDGDGGTPPLACSGVWNPSSSTCAAAVCDADSYGQAQHCAYDAGGLGIAPHCECIVTDSDSGGSTLEPIDDCNSFCQSLTNAGFNGGTCQSGFTWNGLPIKNPCAAIGGTHVVAGDIWCPIDGNFHTNQWCCCWQGI